VNPDTKTTVDWLRFRTRAELGDTLEAMAPMFGQMADGLHFGDEVRGLHGFHRALPIFVKDVPVGRVDFGGAAQRDWARFEIPGKGCSWVTDWSAIDAVEDLPETQLRRADLALTTWRGEVSHETVVAAHDAGRFTHKGRPPNMRTITNSDPTAGRTVYIGQRTADKFLRCYEKGYELASKMPGLTHVDGFQVADIYRVELELKAGNTDLPWDVVHRRDQYFAGSYPFCADIIPGVEADILQRRPEKAAQRDLAAALANVRVQYGATLFTALHAYHGDIGAVWDQIIGDKHNETLKEAGVLLVDHDE
jgi:DNA relaxase NicK